jgi:hypothetical protein
MAVTTEEVLDRIRQHDVDQLNRMCTFGLGDAMRAGSRMTKKAKYTYGNGGEACALGAAGLAAAAYGFIDESP